MRGYLPIQLIAERNKALQKDPDSILTNPPDDIEKKIALLKGLGLPAAFYVLGKIYNNPELDVYDPDKAFEYFQNANDYLPAQKELLFF